MMPSPQATLEATGRDLSSWLEVLDAAGAAELSHKEIVAHLEREHPEVSSGWWRQSIAVDYERARGRRAVGQTADAGFQVGVQRTIPADAERAWELITSRPDLWLGEGAAVTFEKGEPYEVSGAQGPQASGEVRVVKPGDRLRMTWQPSGWSEPATLQLALSETKTGKTAINVHLEKLPDGDAREEMKRRWREALERIAAEAG